MLLSLTGLLEYAGRDDPYWWQIDCQSNTISRRLELVKPALVFLRLRGGWIECADTECGVTGVNRDTDLWLLLLDSGNDGIGFIMIMLGASCTMSSLKATRGENAKGMGYQRNKGYHCTMLVVP